MHQTNFTLLYFFQVTTNRRSAKFQRLLDTHKILCAKHVALGAEHEKRGNFLPQHLSVSLVSAGLTSSFGFLQLGWRLRTKLCGRTWRKSKVCSLSANVVVFSIPSSPWLGKH